MTGAGTLASEAPPSTRVLIPVADARVEGPSAEQNFGGSSVLKVDSSPAYASYLRFELGNLTSPVLGAKLRLYATDATVSGPDVSTTGDAWQEKAVTYLARPANQTWVARAGAVAAESWVEWDVTSAVQGRSTVSFAL
ncbi:MAG: DNRLRE domain-containing protein, partial [Cystobacter sp.]